MSLIRRLKTSPIGQQVRHARKLALDPLYWRRSRGEFRRLAADAEGAEGAIQLLWTYRGAGFYRNLKPNQDRGELTALAEAVTALRPRVIVEIGTRDGGTLLVWSRCSPGLAHLVSIDLPGGIHGGGYPPQRERFYRLFAEGQHGLSLHLLRQDSQTEASRDAVLAALGGQPVDFLFIDGDHRYPGVSRDYALYAPLVRPGGLIAFHDIRPNRFDPSIEVWRLWDAIKASGAPAREFIHEPYGGRYGIGVVEWMG